MEDRPFNTPPLSPMMLDADFQDSFPFSQQLDQYSDLDLTASHKMFSCHGNRSEMHRKNYVENFKRILMSNSVAGPKEHLLECFGHTFVMDLFPENMPKLFLFLRQWIGRFRVYGQQSVYNYQQLREEVVTFLDFIKMYLLRLRVSTNTEDDQFLQSLLHHLHSMLLFVDRLTEITFDKNVGSLENNFFHMCLDLHWKILELLYIIHVKFAGREIQCQFSFCKQDADRDKKSVFDQMVHLVLWELVTMALHIFKKTSTRDCLTVSPFVCPCVSDLWEMVVLLLNNQQTSNTQSFWLYVHNVIQLLQEGKTCENETEIDSDVYMYPETESIKGDNSSFSLWLILHLSALDSDETRLSKTSAQGNYHDVIAVLKKCLTTGDIAETNLRFYVHVCLKLAAVWGPNTSLLVLLWDYFYRRLNNSFQVSTSSLDGFTTISKSAGLLVETCTRLSSGQYLCIPQDNSYHMFLGLLCSSLKLLLDERLSQEWKQMKGRVYSKFHMRRIQELKEVGLHNFCCLFISLALTADLEDVSNKMCVFCEMVELSHQHIGRKITVWKGMFAIAIIYVQRKLDISFLAVKLVKEFNCVCQEYEMDCGNRFTLWRLICVYLEFVQEVMDRSDDFCFSQHLFIGEGIVKLLTSCTGNELQNVLTFLLEVVSKLRSVAADDLLLRTNKELYTSLMAHMYPALRGLSCTQTPPPQVADLLAGLSLLAVQMKEKDHFLSLFRFCIAENINKIVTSRYLSQILPAEGMLDELSQCLPSYQSVLIQTWIRCVILVSSASSQLSCIFELSEVQEFFRHCNMEVTMETDQRLVLQFFKAIQSAYTKTEGWKERIEMREKVLLYFADIHKQISSVLQSLQPLETLNNIYAVIGYLVKCCAPLIFVQSKPDCPLPNIINSMIVPHMMFNTEKPASPVFLNVVREYLHLFVIGLSKLEYKKAPYVQRRLGDIVSIYLPKYWNTSTGGSAVVAVHPLVTSLKDSFIRQPTERALTFRNFVLDLVNSRFLQSGPLMLTSNHKFALQYIKEIVNRTTKKEVLASDATILLYSVLKVHLLSDVQILQQNCQYLVSQYMESACLCQEHNTRQEVCDIVVKFVGDYKKTHLEGALKTIEKIPRSFAPYIQNNIKQIEHYIIEHEANRGVGSDTRIRAAYLRFVRNLGSELETEKT